MNNGDTIRLSIEVTKETNDKLGDFIQWGLKADAIRALIDLLIKAHDNDQYVVLKLFNGRCCLTDIQNLK